MSEGTRFGRYDLLEPIAKGGMAEVFKARARDDVGFERIVAVKRILPNLAADEEFVSMFVDEAKIAVQLTHASIAQIFDLGRVDDHYYIALEYIHGRDLRAITTAERARGGAVPINVACFIIMKVAEALDYAHRAAGRDGQPLNVIHRDVSPQNVIVSFDGDVKVIDFGLAKAAGRATQTQAGILKGKLAYLSPEQAQGDRIDWRSDLFALGILLFELLTGQRLFLRDNDLDTVLAVRNGEVPDPRSIAGDISDELAATVLKALNHDRNARFQRGRDLAEALEAYLYSSGEPMTRRKVGEYLTELFPEAFMKEEELSEMLGVELIEEAPAGVSDAHPPIAEAGLGDSTDRMAEEPEAALFDEEESRTEIFMPSVEDDATGPSPEPAAMGIPTPDTKRSSVPAEPPGDTSPSSIPPPAGVPEDLRATVSTSPETQTGVEVPAEPEAPAPSERVTVEARVEDPELVTAVGAEPLTPVNSQIGLPPGRSSRPEVDDTDALGETDVDDEEEPRTIDEPDGAPGVETVEARVERDTIPAPAPDEKVSSDEMLSSAVQSLAPLVDADEDDDEDGTVVTKFSDDLTRPIDNDSEEPPRKGSSGQGRHRG